MTVDRETARVKIVTACEALRATAPIANVVVEYDNNRVVNLATDQSPYVKVWIHYTGGEQIGLGPNGGDRATGSIIVEARQREGTGSSASNKLLSHFYTALQRSDALFPVRTMTARHASPSPVDGWARVGVAIPFWWDNL